ncbi:hypothetical protein KBZ21_22265 [Streptomyces sp. A73]|uniref:hypothetical protein n=1 Tax=unclassified Streptomyces TaxID=2593676 RepID=UPI001B388C95|nr:MULTISPECIES: hypothetical protein [unclassified Streptomyces]MBQ0867915.1 hypothetical protein [Streptomyces sp. RK75]MBQ1118609.1 hypothetical protein [Streptomyces sp. B15]MBQ1160790.1 hypothetical protein [Streptomyces sp. A73]
MRSQESTARSRRGSRLAASAALVCLGAPLVAGCGSGGDDGYVAVGAADPSGRSGDGAGPARPDDKVRMVPLPGDGDGKGGDAAREADGSTKGARGGAGDGRTGGTADADDGAGTDGGATEASGSAPSGSEGSGGPGGGSKDSTGPDGSTGASPGSGNGGGSGPGAPGSPSTPSGPAALTASEPQRAKTEDRWCEKVTVRFTNSGGRTVTGGKVTFGTHIIGALGVDWATRESTRALPVPIRAGEKKEKTWTVCVDAWRVPLGMHVETREVRLSGWK